jgi:hypothetical protein
LRKNDPLSWVQVTPDTSEVDDDTMDVDAAERQFQRTTGTAEETVDAIDDDGIDDEHWDADKAAAEDVVDWDAEEPEDVDGATGSETSASDLAVVDHSPIYLRKNDPLSWTKVTPDTSEGNMDIPDTSDVDSNTVLVEQETEGICCFY